MITSPPCSAIANSAALAAIIIVGKCSAALGMTGITEASAMRRPPSPLSRNRGSVTASPSRPIRAVPAMCHAEPISAGIRARGTGASASSSAMWRRKAGRASMS